ncbi:ABC transporter ATP-binding protein/permease [Dorea formicigenerans]|uniref:ABC transporter ATP-binding protein n=1 Tax=Dorea formicigenerans TaxID=39486 RepID=UPI001D08A2A3|nr:ABC transporter ATP-binding protein [Dorea formicigenerans]MCC3184420.1 ABC transporter ATP-binding protein/permease [[Clostridium] innocuum]MCB6282518.1 ABC transporter ATP-binding protein/permease [Dorea formicigenerans]MCB6379888.1 ABC transporter ATP-binding protein/permease [Dorea formicigenerans]MCB6382949.1 ABC transporter ATP-binding protein/permease [Dorea formicigenerans]MCB6388427.1 ABC transporter ATP-binding protein/permease [Dorea formicigenerans]
MRKLFQFLKPYAPRVLLILCVLVVQAYCDLSLPTYTSNIVNVGIQQSGIDEEIPENISEEEMNRLLLFVSEDDRQDIQDAYEKSSESFDYDGEVLTLKDSVKSDNEKLDALTEEMKLPMMLTAGFENGSDTTKQMEGQLKEQMSQVPGIEKMSVFDIFGMMDDTQRAAIVDKITEQMDKMPDSILDQAAISYVKSTYEQIGLDTGHMSTVYILKTGAKMLGLAALGMAASILACLMASRVGAKVGRGLRRDTFRKVIGFSNAEFDKFSTASLITRSTNDIQQIQLLTVMILRMVLYAPIMAIGGILKVSKTNVDMFWIIGLAVLLIVMVVAVLFIVVMPKFKIVQNMVDKLNLVSREILTGLPVIRAFHTEKHEEERFDKANKDLTKLNLFVNRAMTFMMPTMMLVMNGITVLIVWVGGHSINDGAMQVGDMMAFIQYAMQIIMSFLMICMISVMLPRAAVSAERVDKVLKSETKIHDPKEPKTLPKNGKGEVAFEHVSFHYPGAEEDVLHDITFTAKPGETTAFIGSTGCGKSTLVNLIPRFYDVTEGKITIDGQDVRDLTQHELRDKLGYVPQKGVLFSGNIASNIMFGNPAGSEQEMTEAAQIAQAVEFIDTKPERYKSPISQGGANVSGGQKQRLSIARAIAKHPDIYIFDDSFSALDYKTDTVLRSALKEKTTDSVVLIVAQRISTILHAEQIIVLDDGKIVGKGTHEELLKTCDAYYQIAASQLSESELKEAMKEED